MKRTIIGVAGSSGSGKTTIAKEIHKHYGSDKCITISSDNYYKDFSDIPIEKRDQINFDHPDSIDFELLEQHLILLKQGQTISIPNYDFNTHSRTYCLKNKCYRRAIRCLIIHVTEQRRY